MSLTGFSQIQPGVALRPQRGLCALVAVVGLFAAIGSPHAAADIWVLDKTASEVRFSYDHFGLSRQAGRVRDMDGRLEFTPTDPESGVVDVTINAAGLSTGVAELDRVLKSTDFFSTQRHPTIRFRSTRVVKTGDKSGTLDGEMTLLGITNPVRLDVTWNYTGEYPLSAINPAYQGKWVSGFSARTVIQRSQWGMKRGIPLLPDDVEIAIEVEFLKAD